MPLNPDTSSQQSWTPVIASAAVLLAVSLVLGALSDGVHHDDDLTHFMMARWAWWHPGYLVNVWGRPGFTVPMALVAWIGEREFAWHIARALSAFVTLAGAMTATVLAKRLGLRSWRWTLLLCYVQPLNMVLSYTTLTENFTALYLIAALLLIHRRAPIRASLVFSLALVSRLEMIGLVPIWWCVVFWSMRFRLTDWRIPLVAAASLWAPIAHNASHWVAYGTWPASVFFHPSGSTEYLAAGPLAYVPPLIWAASPIVLCLVILGAKRLVRRGAPGVVAMAGAYLAVHWLIVWFGIFASGGFARFAVAVAPLLAVGGVAGMDVVREAVGDRRRAKRCAIALVGVIVVGWIALVVEARAGRLPWQPSWGASLGALLIPTVLGCLVIGVVVFRDTVGRYVVRGALLMLLVCAVVQLFVLVRPLHLKPEHAMARDVVTAIGELGSDRQVLAPNPWVSWFAGHVEDPRFHKGPQLLSVMPAGSIFVWDSIYSESDYHGMALTRYRDDPAYRLVREFGGADGGMRFVMFEKMADTDEETGADPYPMPLTVQRAVRPGRHYARE